MGALVDKLGKMTAGQLIRAEDWNELVAAVEEVETDLTAQVNALTTVVNNGLAALNTQVAALTAWRGVVEPMLAQYVRVTLETSKLNFAIGEQAQINAQVTDLFGNPLNLANAQIRPFVDFIATWGKLKPAPGFESLGGAGDRSISVRVNAQGVARAILRSEHVEGFSDNEELEIESVLNTVPQGGASSIGQMFLTSSNPESANQQGAFRLVSNAYERRDSRTVQRYADTFYLQNQNQFFFDGGFVGTSQLNWRDYRSTVLVVVKSDLSPQTPDHGRGSSSIQVTFRDWISPWIILDYVRDTTRYEVELRPLFESHVTRDFVQTTNNWRDEVVRQSRDKGVLGKQRTYKALQGVLGQVNPADPPVFLSDLKRSMQDAVTVQQSVLGAQAAVLGLPAGEPAFNAFSTASTKPDAATAGVQNSVNELRGQLTELRAGVETAKSGVTGAENKIASLGGRLDGLLATGGEIGRIRADVADVQSKVQVLRDLDPSNVREGLIAIEGLNNRVFNLERGRPIG